MVRVVVNLNDTSQSSTANKLCPRMHQPTPVGDAEKETQNKSDHRCSFGGVLSNLQGNCHCVLLYLSFIGSALNDLPAHVPCFLYVVFCAVTFCAGKSKHFY